MGIGSLICITDYGLDWSYSRIDGINFVDLLKLRWSDRKGNHFIFIRHKTRRTRRNNIRPIMVHVTDKIQSLLIKVGDQESHFVLGLVKRVDYDDTYLANLNNKLRKKINRFLRKLGIRLNLSVPLDISLARDCYANTLKRANVNPVKIAEQMNHSSFVTTQNHYLDAFDTETMDEVNTHIL